MRSLSVKQQPNVNFTYQSSPTKITSYNYTHHHQQPDIIINTKPTQPSSNISTSVLNNQRSHIKIVQARQTEAKLERRHKIFEDVGKVKRLSKQRNRSYTIFNGVSHQSTNKIKDIVFTKQSCKDKQVQTQQITTKQLQHKISTFNPSPPKHSFSNEVHHTQSPLHIQPIHNQTINNSWQVNDSSISQKLQQQLTQKQRQVNLLKLQLQRYERCDKLTLENESIYKRLVERLDEINLNNSLKENGENNLLQTKNKVGNQSPHTDRIVEPHSQTTRFLYPSTQKKYSNQKKSIGSLQSQIKNVFQDSPAKSPPNQEQVKTITFQKTHHNKVIKKNELAKYPSPFMQQENESLPIRRSQYIRHFSNTVDMQEWGVYDRLSSINKQLQNKFMLRSELIKCSSKHPASQMMRGRSISSTRRQFDPLKYLL